MISLIVCMTYQRLDGVVSHIYYAKPIYYAENSSPTSLFYKNEPLEIIWKVTEKKPFYPCISWLASLIFLPVPSIEPALLKLAN